MFCFMLSLLLGSEVFSPKMNGDRVSPSGSCSSCEIDEGLIAALCPAETAINKVTACDTELCDDI